MDKRILITGANGVVGGAVAKRLREAGADVAGISLSTGYDLRSAATLESIAGPFDSLIHCAAAFGGDGPESAENNELTNVLGTVNAAALAARTGCAHFILVSTIFAIRHEKNGYYDTSYAATKRRGEAEARKRCEAHGIKLAILRLPPIYDAAGRSRPKRGFLFGIMDAAMNGTPLNISATDALRNFMLDEDAAELIARVAEQGVEGEFDIAHPQSHTVADIARFASEAAGRKVSIVRDSDMPAPPPMFIPPESPLFGIAGFRPRVSLEEGIAMIIRNMKQKDSQ